MIATREFGREAPRDCGANVTHAPGVAIFFASLVAVKSIPCPRIMSTKRGIDSGVSAVTTMLHFSLSISLMRRTNDAGS